MRKQFAHRPGRGQRIIVKKAKNRPKVFQAPNGRWIVEVETDSQTLVMVDAQPKNLRTRTKMYLTKPVRSE